MMTKLKQLWADYRAWRDANVDLSSGTDMLALVLGAALVYLLAVRLKL